MSEDPKANYAPDGDHAEKGPQTRDKAAGTASVATSSNEESNEFRSDAKIWSLYLNDAREEATIRAKLLETGLDTLLILAGLFAGVVSTFLIESRRDLRLDDQEAPLIDIGNAPRNQPPAVTTFKPSAEDLWINGLWFSSLVITLFSALMGVLAKSLLVKYTPATTGQQAQDAYQRWMLDRWSERWKTIISFIPFLIQIAFFLFALGLGIQVFSDHSTLGIAVLSEVSCGWLLYFWVCFVSLYKPAESFSFQTLLSDSLLELQELPKSRKKASSPTPSTGPNNHVMDTLATIWYEKLIQSLKPDHVDEAIAELNRKTLKRERIKFFAERNTPSISLRRLAAWMSPESQYDLPKRNNILSDHLQALSQFVGYSETQADSEKQSNKPNLKETLSKSLRLGQPLHRLNNFPEPIRALAFSVRTAIFLNSGRDISPTDTKEIQEQPWKEIVLHAQSSHRRSFMIAASRALVQGKANLAKGGAFAISYHLANVLAHHSEEESRWESNASSKQEDATTLSKRYLTHLYNKIVEGWKSRLLESAMVPVGETKSAASLPSNPASALRHTSPRLRQQGIANLKALAEEVTHFGKAKFNASISFLIDIAVDDSNEQLRESAMEALRSVRSNEELRETLKSEVQHRLERRIIPKAGILAVMHELTDDDVFTPLIPVWIRAIISHSDRTEEIPPLLKKLAANVPIRHEVEKAMWKQLRSEIENDDISKHHRALRVISAIAASDILRTYHYRDEECKTLLTHLIDVSMESLLDEQKSIRSRALEAFQGYMKHAILHNAFKDSVIPRALKSLRNDHKPGIREDIFSLLKTLAEDEMLRVPLGTALIKDADKFLKRVSWQERLDLVVLLEKVLEQHEFPDGIKTITAIIIDDDDNHVRQRAMEAFEKLSLKDDNRKIHQKCIQLLASHKSRPQLGNELLNKALNDDIGNLRLKALKLLTVWANEGDGTAAVSKTISTLDTTTVQGKDGTRRVSWVSVLESVAGHGEDMGALSRLVDKCFKDKDEDVRRAAVKSMKSLIEKDDPMFIERIKAEILDSMSHGSLDWDLRRAWMEILARICILGANVNAVSLIIDVFLEDKDKNIRLMAVKLLKDPVITQVKSTESMLKSMPLKDSDWEVRQAWTDILANRCERGENTGTLSSLVDLSLEDKASGVRLTAVNSIRSLAKRDDTRSMQGIKERLPMILALISKDHDSGVRRAWTETLAILCKSDTELENVLLKMIELTVIDEDKDVRTAAFKGLSTLPRHENSPNSMTSRLTEEFEAALKHSRPERRSQAIVSLRDILITTVPSESPTLSAGDVIRPLLPPLVNIALTAKDTSAHVTAEKLLVDVIQREDLLKPLLSALSTGIASVTEKGKSVALRIMENVPEIPNPSVYGTVIRDLIPLLQNPRGLSRATALELLVIIAGKATSESSEEWTDSTILNVIITIALEDESDHNIRRTALTLLIKLCDREEYPRTIRKNHRRFMPLLEVKELRTLAVELMALLAKNVAVRKYFTSRIAESVLSETPAKLGGVMELLSGLIDQGRFSNVTQASDYVLVFIASALVSKDSLAEFRFMIITGLWANCRGLSLGSGRNDGQTYPNELVQWFQFAIFDRHVTKDELDLWLGMKKYLPVEQPVVSVD